MRQKNTCSARPELIATARGRARTDGRTLNEVVRAWLEGYVASDARTSRDDDVMALLRQVASGRTFSRDEAHRR